jgi:hypothetical protein
MFPGQPEAGEVASVSEPQQLAAKRRFQGARLEHSVHAGRSHRHEDEG